MTTTKTRRLEARVDPATDELIAEAAEILQVTKSAFVCDAVRKEAQRVIARADVTLMAADLFETMIMSLDIADDAPRLAAAAKLPRLVTK